MIYKVRLAPAAALDLERLGEFLKERSQRAAERAVEAITRGLKSLENFPERGRAFSESHRELRVAFGRDGYVVQYRLDGNVVVVARIFHVRERR